MRTKYLYKESFAVIGKLGQGPANNPMTWILPLWEVATANFLEITALAKKNELGEPLIWGAMNDNKESNKRWDESGKYLAGVESEIAAIAPQGWTKWQIPAQTYLVLSISMQEYPEAYLRFSKALKQLIIGTIHEFYPKPGNPSLVDLYIPLAKGQLSFCQSCFMPIDDFLKFGTEADGTINNDYCCFCYKNGKFTTEQTFEQFVEANIPFWRDNNLNNEEAKQCILTIFPTLKRWSE
ncbi:MAG: hypothetical protein FWE36_07870 [Erysipelotrichales bacterium]|nr:hypothetical protein [Erysipelotrichales bacterium]